MQSRLNSRQTMLALAATKISICLFLLRLTQFSRLKKALYGLIALTVVSHVPLFFAYVFQCNQIYNNWDLERPGCFPKDSVEAIIITQGGGCHAGRVVYGAADMIPVFSILIDFICAAFPIVILRNTNLKQGTKIVLSILMGLGIITSVVCIVRTAYSWQIKSDDLSWVETPNSLARMIEVNLGITLACAPVMKPFLQYVQASITGNDSSGILSRNKGQSPIEHVRWRSGFRITPPAPTRHTEPRQPRKIPAAAFKMSYHAAQQFNPPSIVLPIQRWESDPTSSSDDDARRKSFNPLGSHAPDAQGIWTVDSSLERQMQSAVERRM